MERQKYIDQYVAAAIEHGAATVQSNPAGTATSVRKIVRAVRAIDAESSASRAALLPLLEHQNDSVRLWAASNLISKHPREAVKTLEDLAKPKFGYTPSTASTVLSEWRKGRFKPTE